MINNKASGQYVVGVYDNSTDWGRVGVARTVRGALRIGVRWAQAHSTQRGYAGYGPIIVVRDTDGREVARRRAW